MPTAMVDGSPKRLGILLDSTVPAFRRSRAAQLVMDS